MRIFATRPSHQNVSWCDALSDLGFDEVVSFPLLEIESLPPSELGFAQAKVRDLDQYQKVIFVSQNAVNFGSELIDAYWPQLPQGLDWYAIGDKTRQLLQQFLSVVSVDVVSSSVMNSEGLLALPPLQNVSQEKVLIFRGLGGRTLLAESLVARGAEVDHCALYRRVLPQASYALLAEFAPQTKDVIPVFSGEALANLITLCQSEKIAWSELKLVVPGQRVAAMARENAFKSITIAENASEAAMKRAILSIEY